MVRLSSGVTSEKGMPRHFSNKWKVIFLIFFLAFSVRLITLNRIGKTWDEGAYVELGYKYIQLVLKHDFSDSYWYMQSDHPPLARYLYGIAGSFDIEKITGSKVIFKNSYSIARMVSALFGSLSVIFIILIGYRYFSAYVAISSGVIFSLIPFFVGLSQLATLESLMMFFFTGSIYFLGEYFDSFKISWLIYSGFFVGCSILVKQSNVIIIPLIVSLMIAHLYFSNSKKTKRAISDYSKHFLLLLSIAFFTVFAFWPMPFFHVKELLEVQNSMWVHAVKLPPPEVYFGVLRLVPKQYYVIMFLLTTPVVLLVLGLLGVIRAFALRNFALTMVIVWFLLPFFQSLYPFKQHGVRYIIEIYAPFALLCGIGLDYLAIKINMKYRKVVLLLLVSLYLVIVLEKISPYYLDYFNELVGGTNEVYENRLFQMGWWGQGVEEATIYISDHEERKVTVAVDGLQLKSVVPRLWNIETVLYNKKESFDYVIVPYFNVVRLGFPEQELSKNYDVVYSVLADKAKLVKVYKRKK